MSDEPQAPPRPGLLSLGRLWQPDDDAGAPPRVGLTRARVIEAAIELADEGGLGAATMGRVAERLGFTPMSLYRYVSNKDELLLFMHDSAWQPPTHPLRPGEWRARLIEWCEEQHAILCAHPWLERVQLSERAGTPSQFGWMERGLEVLGATPLSERQKGEVMLLINGYVFWESRFHAETAVPAEAAGGTSEQAAQEVAALVREVLDPVRFPALTRAAMGGLFDSFGTDRHTDFLSGLGIILDGIERLFDRRQVAPGA